MPKDPYMLLSFINTKLRDEYSSLEELCRSMDEDEEPVIEKLKAIGYAYDPEKNSFISI